MLTGLIPQSRNPLVTKYQRRISGRLLRGIGIHLEAPQADYERLRGDGLGDTSDSVRARVQVVRDVQNKAFQQQVSRPAFYLHFLSKEDLLLSHVDVIFDEFHVDISREIARGNIDRKRFSLMLSQYWERHAKTLRMVIQAENPDILLDRLKEYVGVIMKEIAARTRKPAIDPRLQELIVGYVAGGAYMLLTQWISNKMPFFAEQMGRLF